MKGFINNIIKSISLSKGKDTPRKKTFRPVYTSLEHYRIELDKRLNNKAERDIEKGEIRKAINRLEGYLEFNPNNQDLRRKLANLYMSQGDMIRAGKHLFFVDSITAKEAECIDKFEKRYGYSPSIILRKIVLKKNFRVTDMSDEARLKLKKYTLLACEELGTTPNFLKGIKGHTDKY